MVDLSMKALDVAETNKQIRDASLRTQRNSGLVTASFAQRSNAHVSQRRDSGAMLRCGPGEYRPIGEAAAVFARMSELDNKLLSSSSNLPYIHIVITIEVARVDIVSCVCSCVVVCDSNDSRKK